MQGRHPDYGTHPAHRSAGRFDRQADLTSEGRRGNPPARRIPFLTLIVKIKSNGKEEFVVTVQIAVDVITILVDVALIVYLVRGWKK